MLENVRSRPAGTDPTNQTNAMVSFTYFTFTKKGAHSKMVIYHRYTRYFNVENSD